MGRGPFARRMLLSNISARPMYAQSRYLLEKRSRERGKRPICLDVRLRFLGRSLHTRLSLARGWHDRPLITKWIFLKTNERRALMYTYSYRLGLSDLNWFGSNDEWVFNVRRSHARFLFFSWTKLVLTHHSMTYSLEAISRERGLYSRMLNPPSRKLVQPIFTRCWVWKIGLCIRSL